ncbi:hypothetical protein GTU73_15360 [Rathayibacter sp. VKM Ac-2804]|uniref:hypothetical protein n=1 Tax=Rathayibacter sp. VKM Ac-2804 TaxID=2609257 RepID=UPI00132E7BCF|nr:hypothetical protein [Rathayibacter sp. VKM Ac-2804]QHF25241.1 hypothetical protein GTU73_15360 [Rathayibacter sp. VKM Ac-2804]
MTTLHHDRPTTSGRRRPRSLDIAVATALTVGLLGGAATAAHAEAPSTGSPAPSSGVAAPVEHPGIDGHFTGVLDTEDGRPVTVGTYITWTAELANTGDVEIRTIHGIDVNLAPGETTTNFSWRKQVTQADLDAGTATISFPYDATTASGLAFTSPAITGTLALPPRPAAN